MKHPHSSAATTGHSVLIDGGTIPVAAPAPAAYTHRGSTANFDVSYDSSLGINGQALADAVLARCEQDLGQLRSYFGGVTTSRFSVFIDPELLVHTMPIAPPRKSIAPPSQQRMGNWRIS
jgi:hypothetical protein